jgi:hypothetical protein
LRTVHVVVIHAVHRVSNASLFEVVDAGGLLGFGFGASERRQEHCGKDGNDCDDDEQLDEREGVKGLLARCRRTRTEERAGVLFHRARMKHERYILSNITLRKSAFRYLFQEYIDEKDTARQQINAPRLKLDACAGKYCSVQKTKFTTT